MNNTIIQEKVKSFQEKFENCTEHAAVERVIDGLYEHIPALRQDIEGWLTEALTSLAKEVREEEKGHDKCLLKLEILQARLNSCNLDRPGVHDLSLKEIKGWIADLKSK